MSVKIRLQRHGKKGAPYYWVVAADARSKRDGKYLEKIGAYNPNTNPATVELDVDAAVKWLNNGAQPTDTAKAILKYKGAMYKKHLQGGVLKGAFNEEQAEEKFNAWLEEKEGRINSKKETLAEKDAREREEKLKAEKAVSDARVAEEAEEEAVATEANAEETEAVEAEAETTDTKEEEKVEAAEPEAAEPEATEEKAEAAEPVAEATEEKEADVAIEAQEEAGTLEEAPEVEKAEGKVEEEE